MFNELYSFLFLFTAIGKCGRARDRACSNRRKRCSTSCCFLKGGKKWKEKKNTPLNRKEVVTNQPQKRKEIPPIPFFFFSTAHHRRAWVQVFQNWKFPTSVQKCIRGKMVAIWNEAGTRHHSEFWSNVFNFKKKQTREKNRNSTLSDQRVESAAALYNFIICITWIYPLCRWTASHSQKENTYREEMHNKP